MEKVGRTSLYTEEIAEEICNRLIDGESLNQICKTEGLPKFRTVIRWALDVDHPFWHKYARARIMQAEKLVDEIVEIADDGSKDTKVDEDGNSYTDHEHINRTRLRVDTRKWVACKMHPKMYGEKITQRIEGGLENKTVMDESQLVQSIEKKIKELGLNEPKQ